ncbi:hypothetical protein KSZ_74480 [Dictyobacter formicarum]|uniref:Uncharacterized protein n=1 Tax=Dictyobacter formicarum TaxID=2778368 RepID=A0ABQ3VT34_9CHLR|nr:hypothetical protein KSZ_74480 [Dictyobacter formicarum]
MTLNLAIADVKGLVVNEKAHDFAIGDIDHRLSQLGIAIGGLCIGERALFIKGVQVGAG